MALTLHTDGIWQGITRAVKKQPSRCMIAVAYFGANAAAMLPLKKGSVLLVNAGERLVKSGQTCPAELIKLYKKGVKIYSNDKLHAKMYVVGTTLFVGSANVSGNAANNLKEAMLQTNDRQAVKQAKEFIDEQCGVELGIEQLKQLQKMYRPPHFPGGSTGKSKSSAPGFFVEKLILEEWPEDAEEAAEKGRKEAKSKRLKKQRHQIDIYRLAKPPVSKIGDTILQIINEDGTHFVSPPGTLIHIKKWSNGKRVYYFCYVEVPVKRRKKVAYFKKKLPAKTYKQMNRNGKKNREFAARIEKLWR